MKRWPISVAAASSVDPLSNQGKPARLSGNEAITLRRVAYGQSDVHSLRSQDLARLRLLRFIEGSAREPTLTAEGRQRFDALPKSAAFSDFKPHDDLLAAMARLLGEPRR
jgi:hypothetical protein